VYIYIYTYISLYGLATTTSKGLCVEIAPSTFLLRLFMCHIDKFCKYCAGRNFQKMTRIVTLQNVSIFAVVFSEVTK
jgi:hypothetical protein